MVRTYGIITVGAVIQGIAMGLFLFPHSIPSGGSAGIALLLNYWVNIPLGFALWIVNFSLLVIAIKGLGNSSAIRTMYSIAITSIAVDIFSFSLAKPYTSVWIDLLIGALFLGIGVGILMRQNVSNGGMGVLALILANYKGYAPGKALFLMNGSIFLITAAIIDCQIVILALIGQWISTRLVDFIYHLRPSLLPQLALNLRKKPNRQYN